MLPWNRSEVLVTNSSERFGVAQRSLRDGGIKFSIKVINGGNSSGRVHTIWGQFGERPDLEIFYYIYVDKADEEEAHYLINRANHEL